MRKSRSWRPALVLIVAFFFALGCATQTEWSERVLEEDGGIEGEDGGGMTEGDGGTPVSTCSALTQGIYVVTVNSHLVRFDPESISFDPAISLCPEVSDSVASVAIDRSANAWALFTNGLLYRASVADGRCLVTEHELASPYEYHRYWGGTSLTFVSDAEGASSETLYYSTFAVAESDTNHEYHCGQAEVSAHPLDGRPLCDVRLGTLDTETGESTVLPEPTGTVGRLVLTGTGSGELWGVWPSGMPYGPDGREQYTHPVIGQIDKNTGEVISEFELTELEEEYWWWWGEWYGWGALAFWGGWFYLFLRPPDARSSRIWRFRPEGEVLEEVMHESGLEIVGAGVSTCAPYELI
jgi:hypothetical protein